MLFLHEIFNFHSIINSWTWMSSFCKCTKKYERTDFASLLWKLFGIFTPTTLWKFTRFLNLPHLKSASSHRIWLVNFTSVVMVRKKWLFDILLHCTFGHMVNYIRDSGKFVLPCFAVITGCVERIRSHKCITIRCVLCSNIITMNRGQLHLINSKINFRLNRIRYVI